MKKLILFASIGLFSTAAFAQQPAKAKPAPTQEPVKVAPVAKAAPTASASRVEPAPVATTTAAPAKTNKKHGMTKVTPKTATATAVPVEKAKQK